MSGLINSITEQAWPDTMRTRGPEPEVSDSEIITIGLIHKKGFIPLASVTTPKIKGFKRRHEVQE